MGNTVEIPPLQLCQPNEVLGELQKFYEPCSSTAKLSHI